MTSQRNIYNTGNPSLEDDEPLNQQQHYQHNQQLPQQQNLSPQQYHPVPDSQQPNHQYQQQAPNYQQFGGSQQAQRNSFNQEINWNSNYRQSQHMNLTPRLSSNGGYTDTPGTNSSFNYQYQPGPQQFSSPHQGSIQPQQLPYQPLSSSAGPGSNQQQNSPFGSPTNQFRNPWYPQQSPQTTPSTSTAVSTPILFNTPSRATFNQLPTTYEYDTMSESSANPSRKNSFVLPPPSRAPAPPPPSQQYYNDPAVNFNAEVQRRQSIAYQPNAPPFLQSQGKLPFLNYGQSGRRQSFLQYPPNLKALPVPIMRRIGNKNELKPTINKVPKYRRASMGSNYISPLNALTMDLTTTFSLCDPDFHYEVSKNPKRVLTKPSEGKLNNGYDNEDNDYILYVNDVLGVEENKKYLVLDILGHGTFAQVVKCQNLKTKELVAIKIVKSKNSYINQSLSEISLLELINKKIDPLDNHNFLRLKDKFVHKSHLCLVFELLSSNLFELIKQNEFKGLSLKLVRSFTKQLLDSLCVLKDAKIIHCDLKPENILLISPDKPDIKVVDFGSACQERQTLYTYIQSRFYRSPEVLLGLPYTTSIDTWSLGCIIAELFLGLPLFPGNSEYDQLHKIISIMGPPPNWMVEMGKTAKNFLEKNPETGTYQMKPLSKYNEERGLSEEPGKIYFNTNNLDDLVLKYTMNRKAMTSSMIDKEMKDRKALVHLIRGLLNLNPLERWTPQQALMHPFVTETGSIDSWGEAFGGKKGSKEI